MFCSEKSVGYTSGVYTTLLQEKPLIKENGTPLVFDNNKRFRIKQKKCAQNFLVDLRRISGRILKAFGTRP